MIDVLVKFARSLAGASEPVFLPTLVGTIIRLTLGEEVLKHPYTLSFLAFLASIKVLYPAIMDIIRNLDRNKDGKISATEMFQGANEMVKVLSEHDFKLPEKE